MKLSNEAIKEFKEIYQAQFGENLSETEANLMGINLLKLFSQIYIPIPDKKEEQDGRQN